MSSAIGASLHELCEVLKQFLPSHPGLGEDIVARLWTTVLAISLFEKRKAGKGGVWGMVIEKARAWMRGLALVREGVGDGGADGVELSESEESVGLSHFK
jgi:hypothetical protein